MSEMTKWEREEQEAIADFGQPLGCLKCGHDVFARAAGSSESVKLLCDDGDITAYVVESEYVDNPISVTCAKCGEYYCDMDDLIPEEAD